MGAVAVEWAAVRDGFRDFIITDRKSAQTARTYSYSAGLWWTWCIERETCPISAERAAIRRYLTERLQAGISSGRVYNDLASITTLYRFLTDEGKRAGPNPAEGVKIKRDRGLPTDPFTLNEVTSLLVAATNERDRLIILLLSYTGLRISELASLTAESFDWQRATVDVMGKGAKERRLDIPDEIFGRLRAFLGLLPEGPLFRSIRARQPMSAHQIRKILYAVGARADLHVHPHRFRATYATQYLDQYGDIEALRYNMGHESIETTRRYAQSATARRASRQMSGLSLGLAAAAIWSARPPLALPAAVAV